MTKPVVKQLQIRPARHSKSKAKTVCRRMKCANPTREKYEDKVMLVCGEEACFMNCDTCTERPVSHCGFKEIEGEEAQTV